MSKIFKALEKAEREMEMEKELRWDFPPAPGPQEEPEKPKVHLESRMMEQVIPIPQLIACFQPGSLAL